MRRLDFTLGPEHEGRRVGRLVTGLAGVSHHGYARLKRENGVLLDGRPAHADERVRAGQILSVLLEDEAEPLTGGRLPVVYADPDVIVLDKPAPMSTMRSPGKAGPTVEELASRDGVTFRPVNRLDKGTSGLMVCAGNAYAQQRLQKLLHTERFVRCYLAVTEGEWAGKGVIDRPIRKESGISVRRVTALDGKPCVTHYETLETGGGRTLVRLTLETGRTHQIRVHLSALGHPVTGDYLYGAACAELPGRFALHSTELSFVHPVTGKVLSFESPLPPELRRLVGGGDQGGCVSLAFAVQSPTER